MHTCLIIIIIIVRVLYLLIDTKTVILYLHFLLFVAKKQKEETPAEAKSGVFVFSNGDKYGKSYVCTCRKFNFSRGFYLLKDKCYLVK